MFFKPETPVLFVAGWGQKGGVDEGVWSNRSQSVAFRHSPSFNCSGARCLEPSPERLVNMPKELAGPSGQVRGRNIVYQERKVLVPASTFTVQGLRKPAVSSDLLLKRMFPEAADTTVCSKPGMPPHRNKVLTETHLGPKTESQNHKLQGRRDPESHRPA